MRGINGARRGLILLLVVSREHLVPDGLYKLHVKGGRWCGVNLGLWPSLQFGFAREPEVESEPIRVI
jgi:hypothetical protein